MTPINIDPETEVLQYVPGSIAFNLRGPYLEDTVTCPICRCPNDVEYLESYASHARVVFGCTHLRRREFREDGNNWYGFAKDPRQSS
jgi:hypothetical protein